MERAFWSGAGREAGGKENQGVKSQTTLGSSERNNLSTRFRCGPGTSPWVRSSRSRRAGGACGALARREPRDPRGRTFWPPDFSSGCRAGDRVARRLGACAVTSDVCGASSLSPALCKPMTSDRCVFPRTSEGGFRDRTFQKDS